MRTPNKFIIKFRLVTVIKTIVRATLPYRTHI